MKVNMPVKQRISSILCFPARRLPAVWIVCCAICLVLLFPGFNGMAIGAPTEVEATEAEATKAESTTKTSTKVKKSATHVEKSFVSLFNGENLTGWEGDFKLWKVENGMIVGDSPGIDHNAFLATKKSYSDFELRLDFRLHKGSGNSGIQFRSKRVPKTRAVEGYQADIGEKYWGCLYDEHRRRKVLVKAPDELAKVLKKDDWNSYVIRAEGDRVVMKINGLTTVDYREKDAEIARQGIVALQIHGGRAMRIDFRNLRIKELARK